MNINVGQRILSALCVVKGHIVKVNTITAGFGKGLLSAFHGFHIHDLLHIIKAAAQLHRLHSNRHHVQERREKAHSQQNKEKIRCRRQRITQIQPTAHRQREQNGRIQNHKSDRQRIAGRFTHLNPTVCIYLQGISVLLKFFGCKVIHFDNRHSGDKFICGSVQLFRIACKLVRQIRVAPHEGHRNCNPQDHRNQHDKRHNPVQPQHENEHHQRNDDCLGQFQSAVGQKGFNPVHIIKQGCFDLSGRMFLKESKVEFGHMLQYSDLDSVHGVESRRMRADTGKGCQDCL